MESSPLSSLSSNAAAVDRRQQWLIGGSLLALAGLAWIRTIHEAAGMSCVMMMPEMHGPWWQGCPLYVASWAVMMGAMMLPAITPLVLIYARTAARRPGLSARLSPFLFVLGYGIVWGGLGIPAYFGTLWLQSLAAHYPLLALWAPRVGAITQIAAGIYQWTPAKHACLEHCRSPLHFVLHHWREGPWGAVTMGVSHGAICALCCAGLMAVLFVLGIMSLAWMAVVAIALTLERVIPAGGAVGRVAGAAMLLAGLGSLFIPAVSRLVLHT